VTVPFVTHQDLLSNPALSPDGKRFSVAIHNSLSSNIWTGGVGHEPLTRLTVGNSDVGGVWSRDGGRLFYSSSQGSRNIVWTATDGTGTTGRLTYSPHQQIATSMSPSGDTLLFNDLDPSTKMDVWEFSLSRNVARPVLRTRFEERNAVFSPDGHWIAYESDESGQIEVYVQPYPGPGAKWRVSPDGGWLPFWSHSGRELFYQTSTALFAVPITAGPDLGVGTPLRLFASEGNRASISVDDQRFLMAEKAEATRSAQLNLVQRWFDDLKARMPTK